MAYNQKKFSGFGNSPLDKNSSPLMDHQKDTDGNTIEHKFEGTTGDIISGGKRVKHDIKKKMGEHWEGFKKDPVGKYWNILKGVSTGVIPTAHKHSKYLYKTFTEGKK